MKISKKKREEIYKAIHSTVIGVRIKLATNAKTDFAIAQIEPEIWRKICNVLEIDR